MIWNAFNHLIWKFTKIYKKSQNLLKVLPKTVLFRNLALIFSLKKPCYLENCVAREPCKRRSACFSFFNLQTEKQTVLDQYEVCFLFSLHKLRKNRELNLWKHLMNLLFSGFNCLGSHRSGKFEPNSLQDFKHQCWVWSLIKNKIHTQIWLLWQRGTKIHRYISQSLRMTNGRFTTISSHFFANYMNIFH